MTPKEKAQELIELFTFSCTECDYKFNAQRSALRAVDEVIKTFIPIHKPNFESEEIKYWAAVKAEIEKL